jgi:hypothetical protein
MTERNAESYRKEITNLQGSLEDRNKMIDRLLYEARVKESEISFFAGLLKARIDKITKFENNTKAQKKVIQFTQEALEQAQNFAREGSPDMFVYMDRVLKNLDNIWVFEKSEDEFKKTYTLDDAFDIWNAKEKG